MFARVKVLWWWKQLEHTKETCEDAYQYSVNKGLFAVSDGMSTVFFSKLWAEILVKRFVDTVPLLSENAFETEWWVHPAQLEYIEKAPKVETLHPSIQSKAREGSAATLATVRISAIHDDRSAEAVLLAFGDSCIFVGNPHEQQVRISFPQEQPSDFDRAPVGLPSLPWKYNRQFHLATMRQVTLQPDDILILATDAVAKWIISNGANTCANRWEAFQRIIKLEVDNGSVDAMPGPEGTWSHFIQQCRDTGQMVNDDVTALIVSLQADGEEKDRLGPTSGHSQETIQQRKKEFQEAVAEDRKDLIAITYGDGTDLRDVSYPDIQNAQEVANALSNVWQVFRREINSPDFVTKLRQAWQNYGSLLVNEPCAQDLKNKLQQSGISLAPPEQGVQKNVQFRPQETYSDAPARQAEQEAQKNVQFRPPVPAVASSPSASPAVAHTPQVTKPFDGPQSVESQEKIRKEQAEREQKQKEDERKKTELIRNFYKALYSRDANGLPDAEQSIRRATYPELSAFLEVEQERIRRAYERKRVWERWREVLRRGTAQAKKEVYESLTKDGYRSFAPDEEQQIQLASKLLDASTHDDDAIFDVFQEIDRAGLDSRFEYSKEEQLRINQAGQNRRALEAFRRLISGQETSRIVTAQMVCDAYTNLLAANPQLEDSLLPDEHYQVTLAQRYMQAYMRGADEDLVTANAMMYYSPFKFYFDDEERSRIEQAHLRSQPPYSSPTVAEVNTDLITLAKLEKAYVVTTAFLEEILWQLHVWVATEVRLSGGLLKRSKPSLQIINCVDSRITLLRNNLTPQTLLASLVEDLILQVRGITDQKARKIDEDSASAMRKIFELRDAQERIIRRYEKTLQQVIALLLRYAFADAYWQQQQVHIEQWLSQQKQTMRISYPERAFIDEPSDNPDPARSWLLRWRPLQNDMRRNYSDLLG